MATTQRVTRVAITQTVATVLEPSEYIPTTGDRVAGARGSNPAHRVARIVALECRFAYMGDERRWSPGSVYATIEQQRKDGSWGPGKRQSLWGGADAPWQPLVDAARPTELATVTWSAA